VASGVNGHQSVSDDELDIAISQLHKRKRKRQALLKINDGEDDNSNTSVVALLGKVYDKRARPTLH
jgi:hypothetical protein